MVVGFKKTHFLLHNFVEVWDGGDEGTDFSKFLKENKEKFCGHDSYFTHSQIQTLRNQLSNIFHRTVSLNPVQPSEYIVCSLPFSFVLL